MVDVIVRSVPEGAEEKVKEMSLVAIERFLKDRDLVVSEKVKSKFESDVDAIRVANLFSKKYCVLKDLGGL